MSVATATLVALAAAPAHAGTRTRTDPSADAPPRFDILNSTYWNNSDALSARVEPRDLNTRANQLRVTFSTAPMRRDNAQFEMYAKRTADGETSRKLWIRQGGQWTRLACRNMRVRWKTVADLVTVRIPTICLGEGYGRERVYSSLGKPGGVPEDTAIRTSVPYN